MVLFPPFLFYAHTKAFCLHGFMFYVCNAWKRWRHDARLEETKLCATFMCERTRVFMLAWLIQWSGVLRSTDIMRFKRKVNCAPSDLLHIHTHAGTHTHFLHVGHFNNHSSHGGYKRTSVRFLQALMESDEAPAWWGVDLVSRLPIASCFASCITKYPTSAQYMLAGI